MLADGLFEKFPLPDYAIALHNDAGMQAGPGWASAAAMPWRVSTPSI